MRRLRPASARLRTSATTRDRERDERIRREPPRERDDPVRVGEGGEDARPAIPPSAKPAAAVP